MHKDKDSDKAKESTPTPPKKAASSKPKRRAASVADEFDDVASSESTEEAKPEAKNDTFSDEDAKPTPPKRPSPPQAPSKPAAPSKPKAPAPKEVPVEEPEAPVEEAEAPTEEAEESENPCCFGYCDSDDDECKKCDQMKDCQANPKE